ncbi:MAG TPA: SBBP repeat-containing protein, partial [Candidatus Thermoplasmatota archaeon]|nr:SBBP repeat-containing protein [Candidatus Thermoplasmatota archaeon]
PVRYASFLGGTGYDAGEAVAVAPDGTIYVAGTTGSSDFPGAPGQRAQWDVFVSRFSADGATLLWTRIVGGVSFESPADVAVAADGSVYVAGRTASWNFPATGTAVHDKSLGGNTDAFLFKLSSGGSLLWSGFIGGSSVDEAAAIDLDAQGRVVVVGATWSCDFPTSSLSYRRPPSGCTEMAAGDGFLARYWPDGALHRSTLFGGSEFDRIYDVAVSQNTGSLTFTGVTSSDDLRISSTAPDRTVVFDDAFVAKMDASMETQQWATFLGGSHSDWGWALARDGDGNAYVAGSTSSSDFPVTSGAHQRTLASPTGCADGPSTFNSPCPDAFVAKVSHDGARISYATYLGGAGSDQALAIAVGASRVAWVAGASDSDDSFLPPSPSGSRGFQDGFVASLSADGSTLRSMNLAGGDGWDEALAVTTFGGVAYATGFAESADMATTSNAYDRTMNGYRDAFLMRLGEPMGGEFSASFQPKGNEWWIEAKVVGSERVAAVDVRLNGGEWRPLELRSWGAWAKSYHAPEGTIVQLRATSASGATAMSGCYRWVSAAPVSCDGGGGGVEPFQATFSKASGNEWWLQVHVEANRGLAAVSVKINDGPNWSMQLKSWGDWAVSKHAPAGSRVVFIAHALDGSTYESGLYIWPPG